jgi:hypothetical protein
MQALSEENGMATPLQKAADLLGFWAYAAVVGRGLPTREFMEAAYRSAGIRRRSSSVATAQPHRERPSGWAIADERQPAPDASAEADEDFAAAS